MCRLHDLHAADAVYNQDCSINFRTGKQIPRTFCPQNTDLKKRRFGHPKDTAQSEAFLKVAQYLEQNDVEQITVVDLIDIMKWYLDSSNSNSEPYSFPHMKEKLQVNTLVNRSSSLKVMVSQM